MIGIGIPPIDPGWLGGDGPLWPGVVAAILLTATLTAAAWVYFRSRPTRSVERPEEEQLPKAA